MASYKNFESKTKKHERFQNVEKTVYDEEGYTPVKSKSGKQSTFFEQHIKEYSEFIAWCRFYPDLFLDLLRPKIKIDGKMVPSGLNLHLDQRVFLRCVMRFFSMYGTFPRGYSKTFCEVGGEFITCILYPGIEISLTAQSKESAAKLLKDKYNDLTGKYPLLKNEIINIIQQKDNVEYVFANGSRITNLANNQTSKGQRRQRIMIEESALLNNEVYEDALKPIVDIGRMTKGRSGIVDPTELNGQIHYFTTSGFRNSTEYQRNLIMADDMINLKGVLVLGADWMLPAWYGRGKTKKQILDIKKKTGAVSFARNYEEKWVGATENQLVDINKLISTRVMVEPILENLDNKREIIIGVDVARSTDSKNNKSAISVIEEKHNENGSIKKLRLVNLYLVSNQMNFTGQSCLIKRIQQQYNAKMVIVDANGLGRGLIDELFKPNHDAQTGQNYQAWTTNDPTYCSEYENALPILYALIAKNGKTDDSNSNIIINFISCVENKVLEMLEERKENEFDIFTKAGMTEYAPFEQTNALIDEIANLKLKNTNSGGVTVEQVISRIDKDRYSSLAYGLWWAMTFDNKIKRNNEDLFYSIASMNSIASGHGSLNNIFS